jgi:2-isopropylmalate synthase
VSEELSKIPETYVLRKILVESGSEVTPTATIELSVNGQSIQNVAKGDGPVDAAYKTIAAITQTKSRLLSYVVAAITGGTDALGEVTVRLEEDGKNVMGYGADTDIIVASAKAYLNALNKLAYWKTKKGQTGGKVGLI